MNDRPLELGPRDGIEYRAFTDPSGGRGDAFTIAIGHVENERVVVDVLRGRSAPFNPSAAVEEYVSLLKEFRINEIFGDAYSANWCEQAFREGGIKYVRCELPKSRLYTEGLPNFTRRNVSLPNHPKLLRELRLLERRVHAGGRDVIDHGRVGSDDYSNVVFGVLRYAQRPRQRIRTFVRAPDYASGRMPPRVELDPSTGARIDHDRPRTRVRWVRVAEKDAPRCQRLIGKWRTSWLVNTN